MKREDDTTHGCFLITSRSTKDYRVLFVLLCCFAGLLFSCTAPPPNPQTPECPVPKQNCQPGKFDKVTFDTASSTGPDTRDYYYNIVHLDTNVNSSVDEYGFGFFTLKRDVYALLTRISDSVSGKQGITELKAASPGDFTGRNLIVPVDGSVGACSIDPHSMTIYFAALRPGGQLGDYDIFSGGLQRNGDMLTITDVAPLGDSVNEEGAWDAQPAISPDGNTLYFASNRKGGVAPEGTDIWCSKKKKDGTWGKAFVLGHEVNTDCDELTPFVSRDGKWLYFASSGHATVGGYDIFRSRIAANGFAEAENIGEPVNTPADEIFPSTYANSDSVLYYASNQGSSYGGFDMYLLKKIMVPKRNVAVLQPKEETPQEDQPQVQIKPKELLPDTVIPEPPAKIDSMTIEGRVLDALTLKPIDSADVRLDADTPHISLTIVTDTSGKYSFSLPSGVRISMIAQAPRYFYDTYSSITPFEQKVFHNFMLPETLSLRIVFPLDDSKHPYEHTLSDSGTESNETWMQEIERVAANLKLYMQHIKRLTLVGNTDSSGTDAYNNRLGMRRAQFVKDQLIERGIPASMILVSSDGRKAPLPRRPGESEELYYARCRRTEIAKIVRKE
ncbi:MAG TPA: OmpA family protein [Candidatus Kapabacteria bacterium]|nr:OmpA family protein [Candidatus Kapabacteria bacterium]